MRHCELLESLWKISYLCDHGQFSDDRTFPFRTYSVSLSPALVKLAGSRQMHLAITSIIKLSMSSCIVLQSGRILKTAQRPEYCSQAPDVHASLVRECL